MAKRSESGPITFIEFTGGNILLFDVDCPDDNALPAHIAAMTGQAASTVRITSIRRSISADVAAKLASSGILPRTDNQSS